MTWPLASFFILALALGAGFASYERHHPSARVLALVATLAALAALGRVAFEPLPNVKPTTDIVVIGGWALGGPAGFAVGAVAALASNLVFGQGPWTPWQMLGWGLCGLLGAAVGSVGGRRPASRITLAAVCGLAGLLFGAVVDFGTVVTGGGEDVARRFAAMDFGTSLPWNLVHAGANVAFALAFGPALQRALLRFRARFTFTWRGAGALPPALAIAALLALAPAALGASPAQWLRAAQNGDGGWGERPHAPTSTLYTGWAALGLAGYGVSPLDQLRGGRTPIDVLAAAAPRFHDIGDLERTMLVLGAAGVSPHRFGGRDLVAALLGRRRANGSFGGQVTETAFGVLALRAVGYGPRAPAIRRAARWLASQQDPDGGWNFYARGGASTPDDTGAVLQALAAAGRRGARPERRGAAWLAARQGRDGGFAAFGGAGSNAQSTAYAVQGLRAAGRDPARLHRRGARSPLAYLRSLTTRAGWVRYSRSSGQTPVWVTGQAALALRGRAFPLAAIRRPPHSRTGPGPQSPPPAAEAGPTKTTGVPRARAARSPTVAPPRARGRATVVEPAAATPVPRAAVRLAGLLGALALAPFPIPNR
jgi:Squalene-hopene cyclase C-terminal domain/Prenyltransferase and squalene oxidase repeat